MRFCGSERVEWRDPQPFTKADLRPYMEVIDRHIKQMLDQIQADRFKNALGLNREGFNYMTVTTENTTQAVTLDTADGTVLRLINDDSVLAPKGALAVVDRNRDTDQSRFLPVAWLKGHEVNGMSQMDGGYDPETFEVCEFQVGDRVSVTGSTFEFGYEGVITAIPATNGDDCIVDVDFPHNRTLTYVFGALEKVAIEDPLKEMRDGLMRAFGYDPEPVTENPCAEVAFEDDEPLAEWEKELLGYSEPEADLLQPGDIAVIVVAEDRLRGDEMDMSEWEGLRFRVESSNQWDYVLVNGSIDSRPDQYDSDFHWPKGQVRAFDPSSDYRVGDLVEADRFGENGQPAKGFVTSTDVLVGGDIEIDWTEGLSTLVAYGPIGAVRRHLTLVGTERPSVVEPLPEYAVGDTVTVTGNTVSGHYLRIGSQAEVVNVKLITDGDHAGKYEFQVDGIEDYDGTPLTQFLLAVDLADAPDREDFTFEAGQEIASSDVLDDLPMGTVVIVNGDEASPSVKLGSSEFGRLNRWNNGINRERPISYFTRSEVEQAADGGGSLVIGFVPTAA